MDKEFVTYEQALSLKELGFDDIPWFGNQASLYDVNGEHTMYTNYGVMYSGLSDGYIPAPLKQQVFRWFRDNYDAHMHPTKLMPRVYIIHYGTWTSITFNTYEEAESACIDRFIELAK
jgi:hypothetical protein